MIVKRLIEGAGRLQWFVDVERLINFLKERSFLRIQGHDVHYIGLKVAPVG